ncbi:hypothetical protein Leryth_024479 [Lithospermum erythrorhizon]|nr:hypothetical protein Leryth_024479 [Lithospermum erythrorhizon]
MAPTSASNGGATVTTAAKNILNRRKQKVVVIMGPTGSGKSKLSIDLSTIFLKSTEIINSDKMQVYKGLDNTTNKIPLIERKGVPHHLLGEFQPTESTPEFTPLTFRTRGGDIISQIINRRKIPFIVGGSNSFIYSLLAKRFDPDFDVFDESNSVDFLCKDLRYDCCFIWVDVDLHVLNEYLDIRVDEMLESGMLEELGEFFESELSKVDKHFGILKAIGVPELENYFRHYYNNKKNNSSGRGADVAEYDRAVRLIKLNTRVLAKRQLGKIQRLREAGWDLHKIDATQAFRKAIELKRKMKNKEGVVVVEGGGGVVALDGGESTTSCVWEKQVLEPSVKIVKQFLME